MNHYEGNATAASAVPGGGEHPWLSIKGIAMLET